MTGAVFRAGAAGPGGAGVSAGASARSGDAGVTSDLALGVDVGGTKIAVGLVERASGALLAERRAATPAAEGGEAVLRRCLELADELLADPLARTARASLAAAGGSGLPIGIALCELVDRDGRAASADTVDWRALDPGAAFAAIGPVVLESDVRAAALAEARIGAARGTSSAVVVVIGTGVASCLVLDGVPYRGAHGAAIVLGSRPLASGVPALESVASGAAIARLAGTADARAAFAAAETRDDRAREVVGEAIATLGGAVATLVNLLDPELIALTGGIGSVPAIATRIAAAARPLIYAPAARSVSIVASVLGDRAGLIGAAFCAPDAPGAPGGPGPSGTPGTPGAPVSRPEPSLSSPPA